MNVTLNKTQYRVLNDLRGLPEGAHMMVMCSSLTDKGGVLEGSASDFDELMSHIREDLDDRTLSATACRALASLAAKIETDCGDQLGL